MIRFLLLFLISTSMMAQSPAERIQYLERRLNSLLIDMNAHDKAAGQILETAQEFWVLLADYPHLSNDQMRETVASIEETAHRWMVERGLRALSPEQSPKTQVHRWLNSQ